MKVAAFFVLSFLGLSLPFVSYHFGWLTAAGPVAFTLFLQAMRSANYSGKKQFLLIWLLGGSVFFLVMSWILQTYPEKWAYLSGWQATLMLWVMFAVIVLLFSIQYLIFAGLYLRLRPDFEKKSIFLIFPTIWVTAEAGRSLLFSIILYGKGASIGLHWNFGILGIAMGVTPLAYLGRIAGMFGLSFAAIVIALCILWACQKRLKLPLALLGIIGLLSLAGWLAYLPGQNSHKIQIGYVQLQQNFDNFETKQSYFPAVAKSSAKSNGNTDILVLPEYSTFFTDEQNQSAALDISIKTLNETGSVVTSISADEAGGHRNRVVAYTCTGQIESTRDKTFLIPIGEYLPNLVMGIFKLFGMYDALKTHQETRIVDRGNGDKSPLQAGSYRLASLACSGAIAPEAYRSLIDSGAQVMTNSAGLSAFTQAPIFHSEIRQFARFMAVANARPFVQAAAGAYSYVVDTNGAFVSETTDLNVNYGEAVVALQTRKTPYTVMGEWVLWTSILILAGYTFILLRSHLAEQRGISSSA